MWGGEGQGCGKGTAGVQQGEERRQGQGNETRRDEEGQDKLTQQTLNQH